MELQKAQRLLHKIQTLLDHSGSQDISRLEKDLLKSYITQLYDAVQDEPALILDQPVKPKEIIQPSKIDTFKPPVFQPEPEKEIPTLIIPEVIAHKPVDIPVEIKTPEPEVVFKETKIEPIIVHNPVIHEPVKEVVHEPVKEVVHHTITHEPIRHEPMKYEPLKETTHKPFSHTTTMEKEGPADEALLKLFEHKSDDMPDRFSHVPIASIEAAMGLNERIFTLNELFGGDKHLFDATCSKLNQLHSYTEAQQLLMNGPARDFRWGDKERLKMAEQFLRIVSRRYPKS